MNVLRWAGVLLLAAIGLPLTMMGLLGLGDTRGQATLCLGLVAVISALGGALRLIAERVAPPAPRLTDLAEGRALFLPRSPLPSRISSTVLLGYAVVSVAGALFAGLAEQYVGAGSLLVIGAALLWVAAPGRDLAGGLWFSPDRLVHEHDGLRWEIPWEDVTGVVPQDPMPILVRPDRLPAPTRTGPRGRAWKRTADGVVAVDTRLLSGGATLASYVIGKAVTDPASRAVLGTPASLPPGTVVEVRAERASKPPSE